MLKVNRWTPGPKPAGTFTLVRTFISKYDKGKPPKLTVRDLSGKLVKSLDLKEGVKEAGINWSNFQSGVYFFSLTTQDRIKQTEKLSVVH